MDTKHGTIGCALILLSFFLSSTSLVIVLIILEGIMLTLLVHFNILVLVNFSLIATLLFLVLIVIEGVFALRLFVSSARKSGVELSHM